MRPFHRLPDVGYYLNFSAPSRPPPIRWEEILSIALKFLGVVVDLVVVISVGRDLKAEGLVVGVPKIEVRGFHQENIFAIMLPEIDTVGIVKIENLSSATDLLVSLK